MVRKHLSKSLVEVHGGIRGAIERCPNWLRPPLLGAGLIVAFVVWRGGLIVIPVVLVGYVFGSSATRATLGPILMAVLVYAPAAGFIGGSLVSLFRPLLRHLGMFGKYAQFVLGAWAYCVVLVFKIMPTFEPHDSDPLPASANWVISGIMGVLFGVFAAHGWYSIGRQGSD